MVVAFLSHLPDHSCPEWLDGHHSMMDSNLWPVGNIYGWLVWLTGGMAWLLALNIWFANGSIYNNVLKSTHRLSVKIPTMFNLLVWQRGNQTSTSIWDGHRWRSQNIHFLTWQQGEEVARCNLNSHFKKEETCHQLTTSPKTVRIHFWWCNLYL